MQLAKSAGNKPVTTCVKFAQVRSVENARDCLFGLESYWFEHMIYDQSKSCEPNAIE